MRQSNDKTVELEVQIKRVTDKAYLIDHGGEEEVWMPKSQVKDLERVGRGPLHKMTVTEWIANEKGLI
jgi:hypothetical protein